MTNWSELTRNPAKIDLYGEDSYFRIGLDSWVRRQGQSQQVDIRDVGSLLIRPDAFVTRQVPNILERVTALGFHPVAFCALQSNRLVPLELWRYQHNAGSLDRLALTQLIFDGWPCVWVLVKRSDSNTDPLPCSVHLQGVKGSTHPECRTRTSIRGTVNAPGRLLSLIHTADEPADVLREFGLLLNREDRTLVLETLGETLDINKKLLDLVSNISENLKLVNFDINKAKSRVEEALENAGASNLLQQLRVAPSSPGLFGNIVSKLSPSVLREILWDIAQVGSEYATCDERHPVHLENVDAQLWTTSPDVYSSIETAESRR